MTSGSNDDRDAGGAKVISGTQRGAQHRRRRKIKGGKLGAPGKCEDAAEETDGRKKSRARLKTLSLGAGTSMDR